jgi:transcriptional repressor NrdR
MKCPKCYCDSFVLDSTTKTDCVERRRECKNCGYRFNTVECDKDMHENFHSMYLLFKEKLGK